MARLMSVSMTEQTDAEIQAGIDGQSLPDVRRECGCLA